MAFKKCEYCDGETVITAENLNCMQDAILENEENLQKHEQSKNNPHGVTAAQIGALPVGWMPDLEALGAAPASHTTDMNNPHGVTAEQVGARPADWMPSASEVGARPNDWTPTAAEVKARPDTWIPSIAEIGAAPARFGLNNDFKTTADPAVIDTYQTNGWYRYVNNTAQTLVPGFSIYFAMIRVDSYSETSTVTQTLFPAAQIYLGSQLTRYLKADKTWSEWEWVNPPMTAGTEYRTTERWEGKPVYRKLVKHVGSSALSGNSYMIVNHNVSNLDASLGAIVACRTQGYLIPHVTSDQSTVVGGITATQIHVHTTGVASWPAGRTWYFDMKYVKTV